MFRRYIYTCYSFVLARIVSTDYGLYLWRTFLSSPFFFQRNFDLKRVDPLSCIFVKCECRIRPFYDASLFFFPYVKCKTWQSFAILCSLWENSFFFGSSASTRQADVKFNCRVHPILGADRTLVGLLSGCFGGMTAVI